MQTKYNDLIKNEKRSIKEIVWEIIIIDLLKETEIIYEDVVVVLLSLTFYGWVLFRVL